MKRISILFFIFAFIILNFFTSDILQAARNEGAILFQHAKQYIEARKFSEAEEALRTAVKYEPDNSDYHLAYGFLLAYQLNKPVDGINHVKKALELKPKNPWLAWEIAKIYLILKDYENVIHFADKTVSIFRANGDKPHISIYTNFADWCLWSFVPPRPQTALDFLKNALTPEYEGSYFKDYAFFLSIQINIQLKNFFHAIEMTHAFLLSGVTDLLKARAASAIANYYFTEREDWKKCSEFVKSAVSYFDRALAKTAHTDKNNYTLIHYLRATTKFLGRDFPGAFKDMKIAFDIFPDNPGHRHDYHLIAFKYGLYELAKRNYSQAAFSFAEAFKAKNFTDPQLKRIIYVLNEHKKYINIQPQYAHRIKALFIMHSDIRGVINTQNQNLNFKGNIQFWQIEDLNLLFGMLKTTIEALTQGRLTVNFNSIFSSSVLKKVKPYWGYIPDLDRLAADVGEEWFKNRNQDDTTIIFWRAGKFATVGTGGVFKPVYLPYTLESSVNRGLITFPVEFSDHENGFFHEFFHEIERMTGIGPNHAFFPENVNNARRIFPEWNPSEPAGVSVEWSWYFYHFKNTIPKLIAVWERTGTRLSGYRNLNFTLNQYDNISDIAFLTYKKLVAGIPLNKLKRAKELLEKARRMQSENNSEQFLFNIKKSLELNPYYHSALLEMGLHLLQKNDYENANVFFKRCVLAFPISGFYLKFGKLFYEKKQYIKALFYFQKGNEIFQESVFRSMINEIKIKLRQ